MANEKRSGGDTVAINVRTINGESTTVEVSSDGTIHDLKIALKSSFPPASSSPKFHLFFQGKKLSLNSRVAAMSINDGDFLVFAAFAKKEPPHSHKPDLSKPSLTSKRIQDENAKTAESYCVGKKRKRDDETCPYGFFNGVLESECKDAFKGQNTEKLAEVLKSRNCLTSPRSTKCLMSWDTSSSSCSCPDWVKLSMETFTFLNLFSSLIQSLGEKLYITRLKESLARLAMSGLRVGIQDVKNLSVICPKVVKVITDDFEAVNHENAIVIAD